MLRRTDYNVTKDLITECNQLISNFIDFKTSLNEPRGNVFYDPWQIKEEFKDTVFEKLLNGLPKNIGEARIIKLDSGNCYLQHADIDDRLHLNISGKKSYLIDINNEIMHELCNDSYWYEMNAGELHTAINIGYDTRYQLVVRKLLNHGNFQSSRKITIKPICEKPRFQFDNFISPWLNSANKKFIIDSFQIIDAGVTFELDSTSVKELDSFDKNLFSITVE